MKKKRCTRGKSCSATCIAKNKVCRVELAKKPSAAIDKARTFLKKHGVHLAEHGAKGMVAWKVGKVLAPAVSAHLESHYGIPREASTKMAETVIQALAGTALEYKHLRSVDSFAKKLGVEVAAAFVGKTAHGGAEEILSSREVSRVIEGAVPILAGKASGIATAIAGSKLPSPGQLGSMIAQRSKEDTARLIKMFRPALEPQFAETSDLAELVADIAVWGVYLAHYRQG